MFVSNHEEKSLFLIGILPPNVFPWPCPGIMGKLLINPTDQPGTAQIRPLLTTSDLVCHR